MDDLPEAKVILAPPKFKRARTGPTEDVMNTCFRFNDQVKDVFLEFVFYLDARDFGKI